MGILLINNYQYALSDDGISYINIAQKYLNGNFADAINGYWGPLISWLLAPMLYFFSSSPASSVYLMKLFSLVTGFFTIIGIKLIVDNFEIDNVIKRLMIFSLIPIIVQFSFYITTPDLLITCILIYYLYFIFSPKYIDNWHMGLMCGFTGALAYLSKSFALPFFLSHFILFNLFFYFRNLNKEKRIKIVRNLFIGLIIFFIISGVWIALISDKYGKITIGTSGEYNHNLLGPESLGHYQHYSGLVKPPNDSAGSAWEDPSYYKMKSWSINSWENFKFQIEIILKNIVNMINIIELFSIFSIVIIIGAIFLIIRSSTDHVSRDKLIYLLITILIYSGGYILIFVEARYIWLIDILLLIMSSYILSLLFKLNYISKIQKNILITFLVLSFIISPISLLIVDSHIGESTYNLSEELKINYNIHGNLASNNQLVNSEVIAFYTESKYYGKPKKTDDYNELNIELKNSNIDYYIVWGESKENSYFSKRYKEITNGNIKNLRIYYLS
ncbi:hypothetical protein [Methanobacterium sp. ACI-7]